MIFQTRLGKFIFQLGYKLSSRFSEYFLLLLAGFFRYWLVPLFRTFGKLEDFVLSALRSCALHLCYIWVRLYIYTKVLNVLINDADFRFPCIFDFLKKSVSMFNSSANSEAKFWVRQEARQKSSYCHAISKLSIMKLSKLKLSSRTQSAGLKIIVGDPSVFSNFWFLESFYLLKGLSQKNY